MAENTTEVKVSAEAEGKNESLIIASKTLLPDGGVPLSDSNAKAPDIVFDPLFEDEGVPTIDELKETYSSDKISSEKKPDAAAQPKDDEKVKDDKSGDDKEKAKAEDEDKDAKAKEGDEDKKIKEEPPAPPRGYVPLQALRESRESEGNLKRELAELRQQIKDGTTASTSQTDTRTKQEENVKTLADKLNNLRNLREKAVEDPIATIQETIDNVIETIEGIQTSITDNEEKTKSEKMYGSIVDTGFRQMESLVPGVHDESKDVNKTLTKFAVDNGLSNEFIETITHPGTVVVGPGGEARYLGNDAAYFAHFLNNASILAQAGNENVMKEKESKIRAEVEKELTKKFLKQIRGSDFKSIGDLPGDVKDEDIGGAFSSDTILSEAEFARLPKHQQEAYLKL